VAAAECCCAAGVIGHFLKSRDSHFAEVVKPPIDKDEFVCVIPPPRLRQNCFALRTLVGYKVPVTPKRFGMLRGDSSDSHVVSRRHLRKYSRRKWSLSFERAVDRRTTDLSPLHYSRQILLSDFAKLGPSGPLLLSS
jgi:hypothetical protein